MAEMSQTKFYPVEEPDEDPRFSLGLALDIARVLEQRGYPPIGLSNPLDLVDLQLALYRFLYKGGAS